tara:strand:- start:28603 stop:28857 length:255 start_codon:yes stop_codon:yes gene_type:complete
VKTKIHINQHIIKYNRKNNKSEPCITVKDYKENRYTSTAHIVDENGEVVATVIYSPDKPLTCGAECWVETKLKVVTEEKELTNG